MLCKKDWYELQKQKSTCFSSVYFIVWVYKLNLEHVYLDDSRKWITESSDAFQYLAAWPLSS